MLGWQSQALPWCDAGQHTCRFPQRDMVLKIASRGTEGHQHLPVITSSMSVNPSTLAWCWVNGGNKAWGTGKNKCVSNSSGKSC